MKTVVSFSGGRTSAYLAFLIKEAGIDAEFIFMDTGAEHPETYEFLKKVNDFFGLSLTCIRVSYNEVLGKGNSYTKIDINDCKNDLEPWRGMLKKYGAPSAVSPYCTSRMKTEPHKKYCDKKYGAGNYETWLGIRADEQRRVKDAKNIRYLAEISDFEKQDILNWWSKQHFDLLIPEHLGNCVFCIKKGLNKVALAAKDEPEQALQFIEVAESSDVRVLGRKHNHKRMYRKSLHLSDVMNMYENESADEIRARLRGAKSFESNSCSESCEIFQTELFIETRSK